MSYPSGEPCDTTVPLEATMLWCHNRNNHSMILSTCLICSFSPCSQHRHSWVPFLNPKPAVFKICHVASMHSSTKIIVMDQSVAMTDSQKWVEWPIVSNQHIHSHQDPTLLSARWSLLQCSVIQHRLWEVHVPIVYCLFYYTSARRTSTYSTEAKS